MNIEYHKEYSQWLWRDMEYKVFGHAGKILLAFPCQDGRFYDFENYGMIKVLEPWIEEGKLQVVCVDSVDTESLTNSWKNPRSRIEMQEGYFHYIAEELAPKLQAANPQYDKLITTGASLGAYHAANTFFRAPNMFDGVIAMSGLYYGDYFFSGYMDDLVYANSPMHSLPNMPQDHPFMDLYRQSKIIFCVGQGAWEDELLYHTRKLEEVVRSKEIPAWFDYWGTDVNHDWNWWRVQLPYFVSNILE